MKIERTETMWAEVKVDIYDGENCDKHRKYFETCSNVDMGGSDESTDDLVLKLRNFPPGTRISVQEPICPDCGMYPEPTFIFQKNGQMEQVGFVDICEQCGFNWKEFLEHVYS